LGSLRKTVAALGLGRNVLFVGYLERSGELLDCYRAGNVFVFASRTETQGLVLLEALALGVPVVSTAVMGTKDVLCAGEGALIAEENEEDFARKTIRVLRDRDFQATLGNAGREWARQWQAGRMASRLVNFYRDVVVQQTSRAVR
jgi:glycosyltransferase involved in cell wall biosynthesis